MPFTKRNDPEAQLQRGCVELLEMYERRGFLRFFHIPNGGWRSKIEAAILKGQGVRAGILDLCLLFDHGPTVFIELKAKGGRISDAQWSWITWLNTHGYDARVCAAIDEVDGVIKSILSSQQQRRTA